MIFGFSCSLFLLVQRAPASYADNGSAAQVHASLGSMCLHLWFVALGDNLGGNFDSYRETETPELSMLVYLAWVLVSSVLMLNLL
jgi:hypothetical protein